MAARVGAKVATSRKRATTRMSIWPTARPSRATKIGMPAATMDPKAMSRMMIATRMPMASLDGGAVLANSSTWPLAPTASSGVLAAFTAATIALASGPEISAPLPPRLTRAKATVPSALMGDVALAVASKAGANCSCRKSGSC